jgi:ABC-type transporter Mla MlaB component
MIVSQVAYDDGILRITHAGPADLAIEGEIDESTHSGLVRTLQQLADGQRSVQIDLGGVIYCDLAGMRSILLLGRISPPDCTPRVTDLVLRDPPEQLRTILQILGWDAAPGLTIADN